MDRTDKYDRRPRVDRYNRAVFQYLELTVGSCVAKKNIDYLREEQARMGLEPHMRYDKQDPTRMRGYPAIDLSQRSRSMAVEAQAIDWFCDVGQDISQNDECQHLDSWELAHENIVSREWEHYQIDAVNAVHVPVWVKAREVDRELWGEVEDTIKAILPDNLYEAVYKRLPASLPALARDEIAVHVVSIVRFACIEEHWSLFAPSPVPAYRTLYEWLKRGRLPCGACDPFPSVRFKVL